MSDPIFLRPLTAPDADRGEAVEFGPDKALELDSNNVGYRVTLARALLDSGDLGEANDVLGKIDPSNPTARVLRLQIQLMFIFTQECGKIHQKVFWRRLLLVGAAKVK